MVIRKRALNSTKSNSINKHFIFGKLEIYIIFVSLLLIVGCSSTNKSGNKSNVILAKVDYAGTASDNLSTGKFDAALNIATKLTNTFYAFPHTAWDSLMHIEGEISPVEYAKSFGVDYLLFAKVNVLKNLMRTNIILQSTDNNNVKLEGTGFATINYIESETGKQVYDPALLLSLQRAFAVATKDSNLFVNSTIGINVQPLPTLVIGSIDFRSKSEEEWELFETKEVSSYASVEMIFDILKKTDKYVLYDIETRDSAYKAFGFHIIENFTKPSELEIRALYNLGVDYLVAGELTIADEESILTLSLFAVENGYLTELRSVKERFTDDSRMVLLEHISRAARKLFDIEPPN